MTEAFDAIIVGSGAGGAAAAYRLAEAGRKILVLEKGERLPLDGSTLDARIVIREGRFSNHDPWIDGRGGSFVPARVLQSRRQDQMVRRGAAALCAGGVRPGLAASVPRLAVRL
ncbi:MAG: FAD-dependent oxidoreductase [Rhodoplanes sp.]